MRVRQFELRLIAIGLVVAWSVVALLVLVAYRPGGPLDVVVGITMLLPIGIAAAAVIWPPVARGAGAFPLMVALGIGSLLVLLPSIGGVAFQIFALGSQTLLPSLEAAYPWLLAILGTSLFAGFGLARRIQGGTSLRRRRLIGGMLIALAMTVVASSLFAGVAIANEVALRERGSPASGSRFGPTTLEGEPAACDSPTIDAGASARLFARLSGQVDLRSIGSVDLLGIRAGPDFRWLAYVATDRELGQYGQTASGQRAWVRTPQAGWETAETEDVATGSVDRQAIAAALTPDIRVTAEDRGIEVIEAAPARRCRVAVDGSTFRAAFPQVRWLVGDADLEHWRGQVDYWIFLDDRIGQIAASANGEALGIDDTAVQATIDVLLTATERDRDLVIYPPAP